MLAQTSQNSMLVDLIIATLSGEPATRGFQPSGKEMPLAMRLTGKFKTAFPDGPDMTTRRKPRAGTPALRESRPRTR